MKNFMGTDGFVWALGVVENRLDPKKAGRVQVRCLGTHTEDKSLIPTEDLPWATTVGPTTVSGTSQVGTYPHSLLEGDWVVLFFLDGVEMQQPVVFGVLNSGIPENFKETQIPTHPSVAGASPVTNQTANNTSIFEESPSSLPAGEGELQTAARAGNAEASPGGAENLGVEGKKQDPTEGFLDPRVDTSNVPGLPKNVTQTENGEGTKVENQTNCPTNPYFFGEPDTNRLARHDNLENTIVSKKRSEVAIGQENIPTAQPLIPQGHTRQSAAHDTGAAPQPKDERSGSDSNVSSGENGKLFWSELSTLYSAEYPYNKVSQSESGHILEVDDTPGFERLHYYHRAGTFQEVYPDGSRVTKVVNDEITVVLKNKLTHVENNYWITVDKGCKFYINKDGEPGRDFDIEVGANGNLNITVQSGDINLVAGEGNLNTYINGNVNTTVTGDKTEHVEGNVTQYVGGNARKQVAGNYTEASKGHDDRRASGTMVRRASTINLN